MAFELWADEAMTTRFADASPVGRRLAVTFTANGQAVDYVMYFGNPAAGTKLEPVQSGGKIVLSVADALTDRAASAVYTEGEIAEPAGGNGFVYRCITGGTTAASEPSWLTSVGSNTADGGVVWRCLGRRHAASAVKLALSQSALANGGQTLEMGAGIPSGVAVAVYMRLTNTVADLYQLSAVPQLSLMLNDCVEMAA